MRWLALLVSVACASCNGATALSLAEAEPPATRPIEDFIMSDPVLPIYPARVTSTTTPAPKPATTTTTTTKTTPAPIRPTSTCENGEHFADSKSCARFFTCVHGRALLVQCPGPLLFNERIGVCDWPRNARCAHDRPVAAGTAGGVAVDRWGEVTCVASEGFYASPRDCGEFFRCHRGSAHRFVCAQGLVFNEAYKTCDWPWNVRRHGRRGWRACRFSKHWQY
ncbi:putative chitinase 10 [Dermacentor variabilis]|uniref:putative chitinase 10 n=1 Tax=Dermacentor variabilis TaxID=34621 RepID=UPI003F5C43C1